MKKTAFIIAFLFLIKFTAGQSYEEPAQCIKLKFGHSLRIPFHNLSIELLLYYGKSDKPIKVIVKSSPSNNDQQYEYSKIDTIFFIDKVKFNEIIDILKSIPPSDIYSQNTMEKMEQPVLLNLVTIRIT